MRTVAFFLLLFSAFGAVNAQAQKPKPKKSRAAAHDAGYFNTPEDWYRQVEGKPFPLRERFVAADSSVVDFGRLHRPTVVCFGFAACPPCRHELPLYIHAAGLHPEIDFVYITYDDEATRRKELAETGLSLPPNYHALHMELKDIDRYNLTLAYPTQYFIRQDGIVQYMHSGGDPDEPVAEIQARIERILSGKK